MYYELRIFIDNKIVASDTITKYQDKIDFIQKQINLYKTGVNNLYLDAGFDLFVPKAVNIFAGSVSVPISHGIKCAMFIINNDNNDNNNNNDNDPIPTAFYLYSRSSTGSKTSLRLSNSVGIIDSGYRGNIIAFFDHRGGFTNYKSSNNMFENDCHVQHIEKNDRLVQICGPNISYPICPILVDDESVLGFTTRGVKGLGSTGR